MEANFKQNMLLSAETLEGIQTVINYSHTCKHLCSSLFVEMTKFLFSKNIRLLVLNFHKTPLNTKEVGEIELPTFNNV